MSFKLPEQLDQALSDLVRRRTSTRSALVREALTSMAGRERASATASVDALVGPLDGPSDLSTNPTPLRGYGN